MGLECVGCGFCCRKAPCGLALRLFGGVERCPLLNYHDGRWWCGAVENARGPLREDYIKELDIGGGCCSNLNTDRQNIPHPIHVVGLPDTVDWRRAFQGLCAALCKQMVSSDLIFNLSFALVDVAGFEAAEWFRIWTREQRDSFTEGMMG